MFQYYHRLNNARTQIQTLNHLKQFHAQIIHHSLHGHNYWHTILLGHCARLRGSITYAHKLFDAIPEPNGHAFTSILKFHSQLGNHDLVSLFFCRMRDLGVRPDGFVFSVLVKSAEGLSWVEVAHGYVVKVGCYGDRYVRNAVMDGYAKWGDMGSAKKVFDGIGDRAVADWNAMVSAYWRCGDVAAANVMFDLMPIHDVVSWTTMVSGYVRVKEVEKARWFFDSMPERNVVSWNAMLSGYVQNDLAEETLRLFKKMMDSGDVAPDETTWVTVISACSSKADLKLAESLVGWLEEREIKLNCFVRTAMVDMYSKCGNLEKARQIFDDMESRNVVSWNTMISGYARVSDIKTAKELFDRMPGKNLVTWNSMISGYVQNGQWESAIQLFKVMVEVKHIKPDEVTMVSVVSACGHLGALETGKWASAIIDEIQIKRKSSLHNALIFMYARCGKMDLAKSVFTEMPNRDIFSYNSLINGLAIHGDAVKALELFDGMKEEGVEPDRITFIGILTACSHAGLSDEGLRIFKSIGNPTVDHYACVIDLLGRAARLDEAKRMIDDMPMKPHAGIYGSLLSASRIHKRVDLGEFAAHKLFVLEPENSGNYVLLANIYASAKRWEDVERTRILMKERDITKATGCSWVEFRGRMVQFIAGDRAHDRSEEMYKILDIMMQKIRNLGYVVDKSCVLRDVEDEEKEEMVGAHSEKLAVAFSLLTTEKGAMIRVVKNLRICEDCHAFMKMVSKLEEREIMVRDNNRFHCFNDGECSCKDYW